MNSTKSSLARACAFASVAVVGVFGIGSLLESTVFRGADPAHVDLLHASRGVFSSILAAAAVAWALSRTGSPLTDNVSADPDDAGSAELARWIIRMRWVAALVLSVLVLGAARVGHLLAPGVVLPLLGTTLLVPLVNLAHMGLLRRSAAPRVGLLAQVVGDLLILTALLHWTGGIGNPLILLMALHVVIAGIVLPPRDCYLVAGLAILLSVGLAWAEVAGIFAHHPIAYGATGGPIALLPSYVAVWGAAHAVVLVAIAHFAATLSGNARSARAKLLGMAEGAVAQRGLLERALATTGTGLRLVGPDLTPTWESSRWAEWFGGKERASAAQRVFEDGSVRVAETSLPEPDPARPGRMRTRSFEVTTAPVVGSDGKTRQVVELAIDVTEKKRAQAELVRTGKLVAVGELAAVVAHEINNPIAILGAKAQLLLGSHSKDMSPKVAQELQKIVELSERVASIAQGLLSACRPARGARKLIDLRSPARRVIGMIEAERAKRKVEVEDALGAPIWVHANGSELEQVFLNLVLNALHAMPTGGTLSLSPCPAAPEGQTGIVVGDTGSGIPRDQLERVFEPFFSTKSEGHGTGLGLSVCLSVVQAHGGQIEIDSEEGQWTKVSVRLPQATPAEEVDGAQAAHLGSG